MAMKCMLQMPTPIAREPPASQSLRLRSRDDVTLRARSSAVNDARMATTIDAPTRNGSWMPFMPSLLNAAVARSGREERQSSASQ